MQRLHLVVLGRVQGVGFRWYIAQQGKTLGVCGAVRNRADGAVEIDAEGERAALERLIEAARLGPRDARVDQVLEGWAEGAARFADFTIARDARS